MEQDDLVDPGEKFAKLMKNLNEPETVELDDTIPLATVLRDYQKVGFQMVQATSRI